MQKSAGFTIVEIIVVCIALGILVSIGVIGWSTVLTQSRDQARADEQRDWVTRFQTYRQRYFVYPTADGSGTAITGQHCLGTGFPGGQCKSSGSPITENANSTIMQELAKVGTLPDYAHDIAPNGYIGPWVQFVAGSPGSIRIYQSYTQSTCPDDTNKDTSYTGANICYVELSKN